MREQPNRAAKAKGKKSIKEKGLFSPAALSLTLSFLFSFLSRCLLTSTDFRTLVVLYATLPTIFLALLTSDHLRRRFPMVTYHRGVKKEEYTFHTSPCLSSCTQLITVADACSG